MPRCRWPADPVVALTPRDQGCAAAVHRQAHVVPVGEPEAVWLRLRLVGVIRRDLLGRPGPAGPTAGRCAKPDVPAVGVVDRATVAIVHPGEVDRVRGATEDGREQRITG